MLYASGQAWHAPHLRAAARRLPDEDWEAILAAMSKSSPPPKNRGGELRARSGTGGSGEGSIEGLGLVVIGRNEGERLRRCLASVCARTRHMVYVDSGSTDGSPELARSFGVHVVELEMSQPFTAARARNAGFRALYERWPDLSFVQFLDGDMEVLDGWLDAAVAFMLANEHVVAFCGMRQERYPDRNVYHRIVDVEWRLGESGETDAFGGDVMVRADAFARVGGYDPRVIAAEDNELALRFRRAGGTVFRIDQPSTLHDVAMSHPLQWW